MQLDITCSLLVSFKEGATMRAMKNATQQNYIRLILRWDFAKTLCSVYAKKSITWNFTILTRSNILMHIYQAFSIHLLLHYSVHVRYIFSVYGDYLFRNKAYAMFENEVLELLLNI